MRQLLLTALVLFFNQSAFGVTRDVCPTCPHTTIQSAIDNFVNGETIRVAGGTYSEVLSVNSGGIALRLEGGYNSDFSARNSTTTINGRFQIGASSAGSTSIDGFTIINSGTQAIYTYGTLSDVSVTNCIIHDAASYAVFAYDPGNITVDSSEIYSNGYAGGIGIQRLSASKSMTITNNVVHSQTCTYCVGIDIGGAQSSDVIQGNIVYNNYIGIKVLSADSSRAPIIADNRVYDNSQQGMIISHGSPKIKNNYFYKNAVAGIYYYNVDSPEITNNLFASNGPYGYGVQFSIGSGAPTIKNNIFYEEFHGLYFDGSSSPIPAIVDHNVFFHDQLLDYRDLRTGYYEIPGDYNDLNHFSYANSNMRIDPRFVDPDNDDYTLRSDSFLIDEGDPASDYSLENSPNGSRINIGPQGNSSSANSSPANPSISSVSVSQSGDAILVSFDTNTATHELWVKLEYFDGSSYHDISPASISGTNYEVGYHSGRLVSGASRTLSWDGAGSTFGVGNFSTRIRASVEHGAASASAVSANLDISFPGTTPTPIPTATPTLTPTITPSSTATPSSTESGTPNPSPSATPTASASPTVAPTVALSVPRIQAKKAHQRVGARLNLPLRISDGDSSSVTVSVSIQRRSPATRNSKRSLGTFLVNLPASDPFDLDLGKRKLATGMWQYCVQASDGTNLTSTRSCATLNVEPKSTSRRG